jgi:hypothetical protein
MSVIERPSTVILPFQTPRKAQRRPEGVLAVVGGSLDSAVLNLALALAHQVSACVDLLMLVEVPIALPMMAYGRYLLSQGADEALDRAMESCGETAGEAAIVLCRGAGSALAAEATARNSADLVIGAPDGGWWARRRARAAITYVQKHAACRIFVVHVPPPSEPALRRAATQ